MLSSGGLFHERQDRDVEGVRDRELFHEWENIKDGAKAAVA